MPRGWIAGVLVWACVALYGCGRGATAEAPGQAVDASSDASAVPQPSPRVPTKPLREGLVIGEFALPENPIVDGDTIRVEGIEGSVRLLAIDTEEKVRAKRDRAAISGDFEAYLASKRDESPRPVKAATPMGDRATEFASAFFEGVRKVRLERDDPKTWRGAFGRVLAYAFVQKEGRWVSYNVEAVRAGMSPYFTKYGYSRRFHTQLARAEAEARRASRGIWNPNAQGYGDYDERKAWWDARADFIRTVEQEAHGRDDFVVLSHTDANDSLEARLGQRTMVLGTIMEIKRFKGLVRVRLASVGKRRFPLIFREHALYERLALDRYRGEPIAAAGRIERYTRGDYQTLQIVIREAEQITLPSLPSLDATLQAAE